MLNGPNAHKILLESNQILTFAITGESIRFKNENIESFGKCYPIIVNVHIKVHFSCQFDYVL